MSILRVCSGYFIFNIQDNLFIFLRTVVIKCNLCEKEFTLKSSLKKHVKIYHLQGSHQCNVCAKYFASDKLLVQHQKFHFGYDCDICGKKFTKPDSLRNHKRKICNKNNNNDNN